MRRFVTTVLALALSFTVQAFPHGGLSGITSALNPLGMNLAGVSYYSTEYPFINLVKQSGAFAYDTSAQNNQYPTYTGLDANGYPVSMSAQGATATAYHWLLVAQGSGYVSQPPSGAPFYPIGTYRLKYIGQGTVSIYDDGVVDTGNTCTKVYGNNPGIVNATANTYVSCTFNVDTATNGLGLNISAITGAQTFTGSISTSGVLSVTTTTTWALGVGNTVTGSTLPTQVIPSITAQLSGSTTGACSSGSPCTFQLNYSPPSAIASTTLTGNDAPRDISVVLNSEASAYDSGAIFNPNLLAMLAPFKSIRFMDWNQTNNEFQRALSTYGGGVPSGATSLTISGYPGNNSGLLPFTAAVSTAGVLTASNTNGNALQVGTVITVPGLTAGTYITALGTGTGANGTYQLSTSPSSAISAQAATSQNEVSITASVSTSGLMTVTAASGIAITTGLYVNLTGLPTTPAPTITSLGTGTGGTGTYQLSYSPASAISSIAGTLTGDTAEPWTGPTGTFTYIFLDGEQRQVSLTTGSSALTWSGALTNVIPANNIWQGSPNYLGGPGVMELHPGMSARSHASNMTWASDYAWGVPIEVEVSLCNQLGASCWFNVPVGFSDSDVQSLGAMVMAGTGMDAGFSGLGSTQYAYFERSNETWNSAATPYYAMWMKGYGLWGPTPLAGGGLTLGGEYLGYQVAHMSQDLQTATGAAYSRVVTTLGAMTSYNPSFNAAMQAADWSPGGINLTTYPIKAVNLTWYWGPGGLSTADCLTMTGQSDGGLADFFATMSSQTGASGTVYSSVPTGGWYAQYQGWITAYQSEISTSYPSLSIIGYEGGPGAIANVGSSCPNWNTLVVNANRDSRSTAMVTSQAQWWNANVGTGPLHMAHYFNDVFPQTGSGSWGALESLMQWYANPTPSVTPKYQGLYNYVHQ